MAKLTLCHDYAKTANHWDFPGGPVVKNPPSNAGGPHSIPGWGT